MRLKSKTITVEYAGQRILEPGEHISGQDYGGSRSFTTTSDDILDAGSPEIRAFGNAQGSKELEVCIDFDNEGEAVAEAMTRLDHCERNQTGVLTFTVGSFTRSWQAGVSGFDWRVSYTPDSVRLNVSYSFILGAAVTANEG